MGRNTYKNGYIQDDEVAISRLPHSDRVKVELHKLGEEFINRAIDMFESLSKGDDMAPILYPARFGIRDVHDLDAGIEIFNSDPTAEWVEFGAHAGGETPILKYRIFGRVADAMEI